MSTSIPSTGFWSALLNANQDFTVIPGATLKITNACITDAILRNLTRTSILMGTATDGTSSTHNFSFSNLCSLVPTKVEHILCNVTLDPGHKYMFRLEGASTIQIYGMFETDGASKPTQQSRSWRGVKAPAHQNEDDDSEQSSSGLKGKVKQEYADTEVASDEEREYLDAEDAFSDSMQSER